MKRFFYLGAMLLLMASCGSSETKTTEVAEDTFGYEMPPEAIETEIPYEGTGNMSDNGENVSDEALKEKSEAIVDDAKNKLKELGEEGKEKLKELDDATKEEREKVAEKEKEASEEAQAKASDAIAKGKEKLKQMSEE